MRIGVGLSLPGVSTRQRVLPTVAAVARNFASSVATPGNKGSSTTNDITMNSWSGHTNYSGATINTVEIGYVGWAVNGSNEADLPNSYTAKALVEYPIGSGTTYLATLGATDGVTVDPGTIKVLTATVAGGIPAGAAFRIKGYFVAPSGGKLPTAQQFYGSAAPVPNYTESGPALTDKRNTTGTPFDGTYAYGLPPAFIRSVNASASKSFALMGMSLTAGQNDDQQYPAQDGYSGGYARGLTGFPLMQCTYGGTRTGLQAGNFSRRAALIQAAGISHAICSWEINDIVQTGDTAATIITNMDTVSAAVAAAGAKPVWCTISPYVNTTTGYFTTPGMTPFSADWTGASTRRGLVNAAIRGKHGSIFDFIDINTAIEVAQDDGRFADYTYNRTNGPVPPIGTVGTGSTTTVVVGNYSGGSDAIIFTSGALNGTYAVVASYSGSNITLSSALASAPVSGVTFRALRGYTDKAVADGLHWSRTYHAMVAVPIAAKAAALA